MISSSGLNKIYFIETNKAAIEKLNHLKSFFENTLENGTATLFGGSVQNRDQICARIQMPPPLNVAVPREFVWYLL